MIRIQEIQKGFWTSTTILVLTFHRPFILRRDSRNIKIKMWMRFYEEIFKALCTQFTTADSKVRGKGSITHFYSLTSVTVGESCYHLMVDPKVDLWQPSGLLQRDIRILNALYSMLARMTIEKTIIEDTLVYLLTIFKQRSWKHFYILLDEYLCKGRARLLF